VNYSCSNSSNCTTNGRRNIRLPSWNRCRVVIRICRSRRGICSNRISLSGRGVSIRRISSTRNLFIQASQIFRGVDTNCNGHLNKREWKHAMKMLGITFSRHEARQLFRMADTNHSGRLSEREFAEFWVWLNHHRYPQQYPTLY